MNTAATIANHMAGMQRAKDRRGVYQNQLALYNKLRATGSDSIAMLTAQAAMRVAMAIQARAAS